MSSGIYQIINRNNGKFYIGSTLNFKKRFWHHKSQLRRGIHGNLHLQNAWLKYGESCFDFTIFKTMENSSLKTIRAEEQKILDSYLKRKEWDFLYNISKDVIFEGSIQSPETIQKRVAALKKCYENPEQREKMSAIGKKLWEDPIHKEKMLKALASPEMVEKNRQNRIKEWQNLEYRIRQSEAHKGHIVEQSTKDKIRKNSRRSGGGIRKKKTGYSVRICHCNKEINIGFFKSYDEALNARLEAEKFYWGSYDNLI
jgi:group I intron endonuclease